MLFLFILSFSFSIIYSFDIGCDNLRVAFASNDGEISVQSSQYNKRFTPNVFSFTSDEESRPESFKYQIGSDSFVVYERNISRFVENPFSYITRTSEFPLVGINPLVASAISAGANLNKLVPKADKVAVTIPTHSTPQYRYALSNVMELANVRKLSLVEKSSAVVCCYIVERFDRAVHTPLDIMFVDVGVEETEISHWRMSNKNTQVNAQLVSSISSSDVSGNALDNALLQLIMSKINDKEKIDMNHLRKIAKMYKELFAFSENVTINLTEDYGIEEFNVTQEDFGKEIADKLLEMLKSFSKTPDRIEFVGGASRFPLFNKTVAECKDYEDVSVAHSLNPEEATTLGAVYYEAIKSKILYGIKINITKNSSYGFGIQKGEKSATLIEPGTLPAKRIISLLDKGDFSFNIFAKSNNPNTNYNGSFLTIDVLGLSKIAETNGLKSDQFIVNATFDYDKNLENFGLLSLKTSNEVSGKEKYWELEFAEYLTDQSISFDRNDEKCVSSSVQSLKKPAVAKKLLWNIYETLYRIKYDSHFRYVTSDEERANLTKYLYEVIDTLPSLQGNLKQVKSTISNVERKLRTCLLRADEHRERPGAIALLEIAIEKAEEAIPKATTDEKAIERFTEFFNITQIWKQVAENVEPYMDPVILCKDIYRRANTLMNRIPELFGPKRHVTHFRTAPPAAEPEKAAKEAETPDSGSEESNETSTTSENESKQTEL